MTKRDCPFSSKIKTISIANELAEAIYSVYTNKPISNIFGGDLNL